MSPLPVRSVTEMLFVPLRAGLVGLAVTAKEALLLSLLYCDQFRGKGGGLPGGLVTFIPSNDRVVHGDTAGASRFSKSSSSSFTQRGNFLFVLIMFPGAYFQRCIFSGDGFESKYERKSSVKMITNS
jgi:hypothetical protein